MTSRYRNRGFTIVELMVTLAVASILIGIAVPAFTDFLRQRTMASRINDFVMAVTYARSEAARLGGTVSVQALGGDSANEWGNGYDVVVDASAEVLRHFESMDDATLDAIGAGWHNRFILTFNARGMLTPQPGASGRIRLCHDDANVDPGREVSVSVIGRTDVEEFECNP